MFADVLHPIMETTDDLIGIIITVLSAHYKSFLTLAKDTLILCHSASGKVLVHFDLRSEVINSRSLKGHYTDVCFLFTSSLTITVNELVKVSCRIQQNDTFFYHF